MSDQNNPWRQDGQGADGSREPYPGDRGPDGGSAYGDGTAGSRPVDDSGARPSYSDPQYDRDAQYAGDRQAGSPQYAPGGYDQPGMDGGYGAGPLPRGLAIAALILGILALLSFWVPFLGAVLALVGLILAIVALRKISRGTAGGRGLAIAGLITSILALIGGVLISALAVFVGVEFGQVMVEAVEECSELPQDQQQACIEQVMERQGLDPADIPE